MTNETIEIDRSGQRLFANTSGSTSWPYPQAYFIQFLSDSPVVRSTQQPAEVKKEE